MTAKLSSLIVALVAFLACDSFVPPFEPMPPPDPAMPA